MPALSDVHVVLVGPVMLIGWLVLQAVADARGAPLGDH